MLNNIALCGRVTRDIELSYISGNGTAVAKSTIAVERDYKNKDGSKTTDFIFFEIMGKPAEFAANYVNKGDLITLNGQLRIDQYEKDGEKKSFTKVFVNQINLLPTGKKEPKAVETDNIPEDEIPF